jgi:quinoprotein glucose dehydrogenase
MDKRLCLLAGILAGLAGATYAQTDWRFYGNDAGHTRFSSLTQITPENVNRLALAWEFDTKTPGRKWENTPVVINNLMYITLQNGGVVALEPETGHEVWRFDTPVRGRSVRAVAYWPGDADFSPRLLYGANDKLWALNPATGRPIESFGVNGVADANPGSPVGATPARGGGAASDTEEGGRGRGGRGGGLGFSISSPPAIYKNLAILGASEGENAFTGPAGDPQAFDVRTGKLVWRFHAVPHPGDPNFNTWGDGWKDRGGPAIWGLMTVDIERGIVFIPTGNPGGSFYGGDRPGDNLYTASIVALDAETGKYKWHYQTTHHDLFDSDLAAAPALIDVVRNGRRIPAVAQITKMGGMLFILDRLTGKPLYTVEERPVPKSDVPGEISAPTQPFPLKPAPWSRLGMTRADITTVTPESNKFCTEWWDREHMHNDGAYTPYGTQGLTVVFSGTIGGGNWGGLAYNPQLGYVFVNTSNLGVVGRLSPDPQNPGKYRNELSYTRFWDDNKYPCQQPPWGELTAVNVNTGEVAWRVPLGVYPELLAKGIPATGTPNLGGPIATASGLVFIGATKDARFRAFDARTGRELWHAQLEAAAGATPMTFMGRDGTQYVVIAAGGPGDTDRGGTDQYPQKLVAFALAERIDTPVTPAASPAQQPAVAASAPPAPEALPPASAETLEHGRQLVERVCTACHAMGTDMTKGRPPDMWRTVVQQMIAIGAKANAEEGRTIVTYLSHTYPPKGPRS